MSCNRYKEALTEAAASANSGRSDAVSLSPGVRSHLDSCAHCREVFALEQSLFASVDTAARRVANNEMPSSFLVGVQGALALEPTPKRRPALLSAPVAAAVLLVLGLTAWVVRQRGAVLSRTPEIPTMANNSVRPALTAEPFPHKSREVSLGKNNHRERSNASITNVDFHPLVPAEQPAQLNRLIHNIRSGAIDGRILLSQPNADLQIPPIVIPALTPDTADQESDGQSGISGISVNESSLDSNRRTR